MSHFCVTEFEYYVFPHENNKTKMHRKPAMFFFSSQQRIIEIGCNFCSHEAFYKLFLQDLDQNHSFTPCFVFFDQIPIVHRHGSVVQIVEHASYSIDGF